MSEKKSNASQAIITIQETEEGTLNISTEFGEEGINESSLAHFLAVEALLKILNWAKQHGQAIDTKQGADKHDSNSN